MIIWPDYPLSSLLVIAILGLLLMYLLRARSHALVLRFSRSIHALMRLWAQACLRSEHRVRLRNHEVTIALAEELLERRLEREFIRIEVLVEKDLIQYQRLTALINEQLAAINEDYEGSQIVPIAGPEWISAVDAIAKLEESDRNSEVMGKILSELHRTVDQHQRDVLREHRWTVSARHKLLARLKPHWSKLTRLLEQIERRVVTLSERLQLVDRQMTRFESLVAGSGHGLIASVFMRFVVSLCFVGVGLLAALLNFQLLIDPLDDLFAYRLLGPFSLASYVACLHTAAIMVAALMIFDGLKISGLMPMMAAMTRKGRVLVISLGLFLLAILSLFEALTIAVLPASEMVEKSLIVLSTSEWLLFALGLVTPIMLAFLIVPLEYFMHTVRPVSGSLLQILLHTLAFCLRITGSLAIEVGRVLVQCYDVIIFIPLRLESDWQKRKQASVVGSFAVNSQDVAGNMNTDAENVTSVSFRTGKKRR